MHWAPHTSVTATSVVAPVAAAQGGLPAYSHVVVVVEENHAASSIIGNKAAPFINPWPKEVR